MSATITVELKGARFFAFHGLYADERKTGNTFLTDLSVTYTPGSGTVTGIGDTIDYGQLYALLSEEMQQPRELLETFVMEMADLIHQAFPRVSKVEIAVQKMQPPVAGFTGTAGVRYTKDF